MLYRTLLLTVRLFVVLLITLPFTGHAENLDRAISVEYMTGEGNAEGGRIGYRFHKTTFETPEWLGLGMLDLEFETSLSFWEFKGPGVEDLNHAVALTPNFSQQFYRVKDKYPVE